MWHGPHCGTWLGLTGQGIHTINMIVASPTDINQPVIIVGRDEYHFWIGLYGAGSMDVCM